ncbi:MAG: sigma-70 family RNA polymerase sigma factor [Proteobacteria bacterium]|nr:sigma-70 family RNA polymerase sigma factor [Pseudomonadota bacterium]
MSTVDAEAQFRELLEHHRGIVFKVAASYARGAQDSEDLAQEIAAQLWRAFPKYDGTRSFSTWMYRIALNVAISHLRERSRYDSVHEPLDIAVHDAADSASDAQADARVRELHRCIARLDPLNRALLILYLDERSQRDIAEILGISETNVATKIGRLKQRLRNDMSEA